MTTRYWQWRVAKTPLTVTYFFSVYFFKKMKDASESHIPIVVGTNNKQHNSKLKKMKDGSGVIAQTRQ
jgi:hypothetical protein